MKRSHLTTQCSWVVAVIFKDSSLFLPAFLWFNSCFLLYIASMGPTTRRARTRRRSSQPYVNSPEVQVYLISVCSFFGWWTQNINVCFQRLDHDPAGRNNILNFLSCISYVSSSSYKRINQPHIFLQVEFIYFDVTLNFFKIQGLLKCLFIRYRIHALFELLLNKRRTFWWRDK